MEGTVETRRLGQPVSAIARPTRAVKFNVRLKCSEHEDYDYSFLEYEECNRQISINVSKESCASVFRSENLYRKEPLIDTDIDGQFRIGSICGILRAQNEQSVSI